MRQRHRDHHPAPTTANPVRAPVCRRRRGCGVGASARLGGIPDVELTIQPENTTKGPPRTFRGTTQGNLTLSDLTAGSYRVEAHRWLTDAERARLAPGDNAVGFVASSVITAAASVTRTLPLPASRRGSLGISEWAFNSGVTPPLDSYSFGGFLELYNNADTTIFSMGWRSARA